MTPNLMVDVENPWEIPQASDGRERTVVENTGEAKSVSLGEGEIASGGFGSGHD